MTIKLTYLISRYPATSHTFILNEIRSLRTHGLVINQVSINDPDQPAERLTQVEREEKRSTFYLKSAGPARILAGCLRTVMMAPGNSMRSFFKALKLSAGSPREMLYRLAYLLEAMVVVDQMRRNGNRHLHVHFGSEVATVALLAKELAPITLSLTIHGPDEFYNAPGFHLAEKLAAADFIFCISHYAASQLMLLSAPENWDKLVVAPLGVDVDRFTPASGVRESEQLNILTVARFSAAKGLHVLLHAFAKLASKTSLPPLHLTLVGDGEYRGSLEALAKELGISESVEFAGAKNQDEILAYYQHADVFCLPSFAEGVPVVLMEAMAMEVPCVSSRITGIPELIEDGVDGLLATAANVDSLVDALQRLLKSPDQRQQLGRAAREKVLTKYNRDRNFEYLARSFGRRLKATEKTGNIVSGHELPGVGSPS